MRVLTNVSVLTTVDVKASVNVTYFLGFPGDSAGKESAYKVGDLRLIPGLRRSPGEGNGYPLQYFCLENSMDCIGHGVAKSWVQLSDFHFHLFLVLQIMIVSFLLKKGTVKSYNSKKHFQLTENWFLSETTKKHQWMLNQPGVSILWLFPFLNNLRGRKWKYKKKGKEKWRAKKVFWLAKRFFLFFLIFMPLYSTKITYTSLSSEKKKHEIWILDSIA